MQFNLKDYLKKFENLLPHESKVKNAVIAAVQEIVGVELERSKIKAQGFSVYVTGSSALKSEIAMKQAKILKRVAELQKDIVIKKIN